MSATRETVTPCGSAGDLRSADVARAQEPRGRSITDVLQARTALRPDALAMREGGTTWTYTQLQDRSERLAHRLLALGVRPGDRVALIIERSPAAVCALLAVLKAGAAYVPLDLDYPEAQLGWMLEDCRPAAVVVGTDVSERAALTIAGQAWACPILRIGSDGAAGGDAPLPCPLPTRGPDDLAYVMYTSGSTGRPKGVMVPHRAVVRLAERPTFARFGADEIVLQLAPLAFDAATLEIWAPLFAGGQIAFVQTRRPSLRDIGAAVCAYGVTTLWLTAGLFHLMVDEGLEDLVGLRQLLAGGDVLSPSHVRRALAALPGCRLINGYGPTENTTFTCCYTIPRDQPLEAIPIGYPIDGTQVFILDDELRPVAEGAVGQLCTAGDGLALGYLDRPDLTAERFRPNPFSADPAARLYLTGDLVRRRPDGALDYLGRRDTQVKIDGKRVELGEIEAALRSLAGIRDAAVAVEQAGASSKRLHAALVPNDGSEPDLAAIRAELGARLPAHMRPLTLSVLAALPLNANGKVDRQALLAAMTERSAPRPVHRPLTAAPDLTDSQRRVAATWRAVLAVDNVGLDDNFFDLGGSSLTLLAVHGRLTADAGPAISIVDLFARPTVRALAALLDGATAAPLASRAALQAAALKRLGASAGAAR